MITMAGARALAGDELHKDDHHGRLFIWKKGLLQVEQRRIYMKGIFHSITDRCSVHVGWGMCCLNDFIHINSLCVANALLRHNASYL